MTDAAARCWAMKSPTTIFATVRRRTLDIGPFLVDRRNDSTGTTATGEHGANGARSYTHEWHWMCHQCGA